MKGQKTALRMDTIGLVMIDKVDLECIIARNRSNPNKNMFENYNTVSNFTQLWVV